MFVQLAPAEAKDSVLEGGYRLDGLAESVEAHLLPLMKAKEASRKLNARKSHTLSAAR